jgi:hypothetical protein
LLSFAEVDARWTCAEVCVLVAGVAVLVELHPAAARPVASTTDMAMPLFRLCRRILRRFMRWVAESTSTEGRGRIDIPQGFAADEIRLSLI